MESITHVEFVENNCVRICNVAIQHFKHVMSTRKFCYIHIQMYGCQVTVSIVAPYIPYAVNCIAHRNKQMFFLSDSQTHRIHFLANAVTLNCLTAKFTQLCMCIRARRCASTHLFFRLTILGKCQDESLMCFDHAHFQTAVDNTALCVVQGLSRGRRAKLKNQDEGNSPAGDEIKEEGYCGRRSLPTIQKYVTN